jgi:hypothetical protein
MSLGGGGGKGEEKTVVNVKKRIKGEKKERGKNERKWEVKISNKCKIGKN